MKKKEKTIKSRLFVSISVISIILVIVLTFSTSTILFQHFMQMETKSSFAQMDYIDQQLNSYLDSVDNYSKAILVDSDIQQAVLDYDKNPDAFSVIDQINIKEQINQIIQSIPYIHSVNVYSSDFAFIASTAIYAKSNPDIKDICQNQPVWYFGEQFSDYNPKEVIPVLSLIRPLYAISTGKLIGYMDIAIPENEIAAIYHKHTSPSERILFIDEQGIVRSTDGSLALGLKYPQYRTVVTVPNQHYQVVNHAILFCRKLSTLNWYLVYESDLTAYFRPTYVVLLTSVIISLFCIVLSLMIAKRLSYTITAPLYHLTAHIQKVRDGVWLPLSRSYNDSDTGVLFREFNSMILAQEQLKNDLLNSQKLQNEISLQLLQQQVKPHFLYNTLDNIYSLAELEEKEKLMELVMNLSTFYRKSLSQGNSEITLAEELAITSSYLQIMQIRYFDKYDFEICCSPTLLRCKCLKLLLQPVVENSIYHGIKELDHRGMIKIEITEVKEKPDLLICITDNGIGIPAKRLARLWQDNERHFGIKNIHQRIQLHYGKDYGLTIENGRYGGCVTKIIIKKQEV